MSPRIDYVSEVVIMVIDYTRNHNYSAATEGRAISKGRIFSSPVAVVIIMTTDPEEIPPRDRAPGACRIVSGTALSGTLQTANIGVEKII
jgi:hypothetical protein